MSPVLPVLLGGYRTAWGRLNARLVGLSRDECFWPPVASAWTVREVDGVWRADWADPDPVPAPVTTIAWRIWHLGSDCLASYLKSSPRGNPLAVSGTQWYGELAPALADLRTAAAAFEIAATELGEDGIWRPLGPMWGSFAEASWAELIVHATDELAHHGAEIALLRDLWAAR